MLYSWNMHSGFYWGSYFKLGKGKLVKTKKMPKEAMADLSMTYHDNTPYNRAACL